MPARKKSSTTRLPQTLREEIDNSTESHEQKRWSFKFRVSRKEARKQERITRKKNKAEFFFANAPHNKRPAEEELVYPPKRKKIKHSVTSKASTNPHTLSRSTPLNITTLQSASKPNKPSAIVQQRPSRTPLERLAGTSNLSPRPNTRTQKEEEEDAYIAHLEERLGYGKGGKAARRLERDGLEDLLELVSPLHDPLNHVEKSSDHSEGSKEYDSLHDMYSDEKEDEFYDEWHGIGGEVMTIKDTVPSKLQQVPESTPTSDTRYIPPHLRKSNMENDQNAEALQKLTRQLKGLLNRMSEQNLSNILDSIEDVYRNYRRNDVTSTITALIMDGIASHSSLLDSYVVLHAAFISSLHKIIGVEFAAYLVQNVVSSYERYLAALQDAEPTVEKSNEEGQHEVEVKGKECSNLIVLLSELYNFQVISSVLVFDIIRALLNNDLTEFGVELLLKIVRNSGQQLRQDDPSALKSIIQIIQNKVSDKDDALSSRTRFMIETLTNLKNNKLKRNMTQNQGLGAVERMKKFLIGLSKKRHTLAHEALRVSLEDLHSAEIKGKWWLVGAGWDGDPLVDRKEEMMNSKPDTSRSSINDNNLIKLARAQGMNTDIRRSIFVVLMSSDDYVDACERLSQLNLTEVQQREIIRVSLNCCGNEKSYNPYYTMVCQHLCRTSHSYKITLQFCLWDFLRELGETSVGGAEVVKNLDDQVVGFDIRNIPKTRSKNVAAAYAWWIAKDCVTLTILKAVDFTTLKPQAQEFFRELLVQIFINSQVATPIISFNSKDLLTTRNRSAVEEIFIKAARIQALAMGLDYFMSETFRDLSDEDEGMAKLIKWANGLAKETLRTGMVFMPTL